MTLSIVDFLKQCIQEDIRTAKAAGGQAWHQYDAEREHGRIEDEDGEVVTYDEGAPTEGQATFIARHDPARALREAEAKRTVVYEHNEVECCATCLDDVDGCPTFRALAYVYAGQPDYQEHWKP